MTRRGVHVNVFRWKLGDCTAGGATSTCTGALLVGPGVPPCDNGRPDEPVLELVIRWPGTPQEYRHAQPLVEAWPVGMCGPMDGGNFVYSTDSRYRESVCAYPIPVHDRFDKR